MNAHTKIRPANRPSQPHGLAPVETPSEQANHTTPTTGPTPALTPIGRDHPSHDSLFSTVAADTHPGRATPLAKPTCEAPGQDPIPVSFPPNPVVADIVHLWRLRQDLKRALQRLDLQCQALCRRRADGDKAVATKLWTAIKKQNARRAANKHAVMVDDQLEAMLVPYLMAMAPLEACAHAHELTLAKLAATLPIWTEWASKVRGVGALTLAGLIGEAGINLGEYRTVSGLWKRMGLAVIDGGRQRKVTGDAALLHGYSPQRRAFAYVVSTNLMRAQRADDPYRALYDRRKAYELDREITKAQSHNRALRVMVKALLKDAWVADRRLHRFATEEGS